MAQKKPRKSRRGRRLVFARCIRHWRTGRLIYPKNGKTFAFWVDDNRR